MRNEDHVKQPTKKKIFVAAAKLFAERGYDCVSMRDLAKEVGITNPSIYNHFASKKEILTELYRFYEDRHKPLIPDVDEALERIETDPPFEVIMSLYYCFPPDICETMNQILATAIRLISTDPESRQFVVRNLHAPTDEVVGPVLRKMIELEKIEPIDVDAFNNITKHYCLSAVSLVATPLSVGNDAWEKGIAFLYNSVIKPTGK